MAQSNLQNLLQTASFTIRDPQQGIRMVLGWGLALPVVVQCLVAIVLIGAILAEIPLFFLGSSEVGDTVPATGPFGLAAVQGLSVFLSVGLLFVVGRLFKGIASFYDCLVAGAWMQFILLLVQVLQLIALLVMPVFVPIFLLAGLFLVIYLSIHFAKEIHGFESTASVAFGVVGTVFLLAFIILAIMSVFGIIPPGLENV